MGLVINPHLIEREEMADPTLAEDTTKAIIQTINRTRIIGFSNIQEVNTEGPSGPGQQEELPLQVLQMRETRRSGKFSWSIETLSRSVGKYH